ncbi:MAG: cytochrome ubiquinol oxidase subunit I [Rhodoblastus sp.]|nr:cytochrome ubiquinol oxidase subunit I [Rhodoblastus sp.]
MPDFSAIDLARLQFGFTVGFHIVYPAFSIGLASYLATLNFLSLWTGDRVYLQLFDYWKRIFAIAFGMGVVSGVVMSYQFGANWSVFSDKTGPILGPLMGYEVLSAFFLEAGFLGVVLFARERVGPALHFFATLMVALGTFASAFWILSVNSWMQTPAGYAINAQGQFVPADWFKAIFNPSFPYRLVHMVLAAYLTTSLAVGAVGALHLLRGNRSASVRTMFSMAMWMAALVAPLQIFAGDMHGLNTLEHQPAKIAAMEGHFDGEKRAPLILFGMPDMANARTNYRIEIPLAGSLILTHSLDGYVPGLKDFPRENWPPAPIVFWSFRVMVGLGFAMFGLGLWGFFARWKGRFYDAPWLHRAALAMGPAGFVAVLAGWVTTEVGRQPYVVQGLLRTADAVSPIAAPAVAASLIGFIMVYAIVMMFGFVYIAILMNRPPDAPSEHDKEAPIRAAGMPGVVAEIAGPHAGARS